MAGETQKPIIFLAFANEEVGGRGYLRNLRQEARRLRDTLDQAEQKGWCEVVERPNATLDEILDVFQDARYRDRVAVFHYGGHANGYQLLLESATGETAAADAGGLAVFLGGQHGLQLVFLNGCSTQRQAKRPWRALPNSFLSFIRPGLGRWSRPLGRRPNPRRMPWLAY
jgi:hypothetical protein